MTIEEAINIIVCEAERLGVTPSALFDIGRAYLDAQTDDESQLVGDA